MQLWTGIFYLTVLFLLSVGFIIIISESMAYLKDNGNLSFTGLLSGAFG